MSEYFGDPISHAEMEKHVQLSREGKLEAYWAKHYGFRKTMPKS